MSLDFSAIFGFFYRYRKVKNSVSLNINKASLFIKEELVIAYKYRMVFGYFFKFPILIEQKMPKLT